MKYLIAFVLLLLAVPVAAQTVPPDVNNPTGLTWTPSTDHATIDGYSADIVSPTGVVIQTLDLGKPAPDATNTCTATISVQPITFGVGYTVHLRARAGTAVSANTVSLNKFNRVPGPPSKGIIK